MDFCRILYSWAIHAEVFKAQVSQGLKYIQMVRQQKVH